MHTHTHTFKHLRHLVDTCGVDAVPGAGVDEGIPDGRHERHVRRRSAAARRRTYEKRSWSNRNLSSSLVEYVSSRRDLTMGISA
jgi:hypothetical protein